MTFLSVQVRSQGQVIERHSLATRYQLHTMATTMKGLSWLSNYLSTPRTTALPPSIETTVAHDETCNAQQKKPANSPATITDPTALKYESLADAFDHTMSQLNANKTHYAHLCAMQIEAQREMDNGAQRVYELEEQLRAANDTIADLRSQTNTRMLELDRELRTARKRIGNQTTELNRHTQREKSQNQLNTQLQNTNRQLRDLQSTNGNLVRENNQLSADNTNLAQERDEAREKYLTIARRHDEALFQLEHLKCIEAPETGRQLQLYPQPFVLVLIDADAYRVRVDSLLISTAMLTCTVPKRILEIIA
jgi:regulator of replication initiation timing